jgi:hypothetical protein
MADLIFTSGFNSVTTPFDTCYVSGTAVVNLLAGAVGTGHDAVAAILTLGVVTTPSVESFPAVVVTGGTVIFGTSSGPFTGGAGIADTAGGDAEGASPALWLRAADLTLNGGSFAAGASADRNGVPAVDIGVPTNLVIASGSYVGGDAVGSYNLDGGVGMVLGMIGLTANVDGVTNTGGAGVGTGGTGYSLGFRCDPTSGLSLPHGTYTGAVEGNLESGGYIQVADVVGVVPVNLQVTPVFADSLVISPYSGHRYSV